MAENRILKPSVIASAAVGLLRRELVIARTVWTDAVKANEWRGALNDTVTIRVPARRVAGKTTVRNGSIATDTSNEYGVNVTLSSHIYNGAPITDAQLTLDIEDFGAQILQPQVRAVAEGIEDEIATEISGATYETVLTIDAEDPYLTAVDAGKALNDAKVPRAGRFLLVGSDVEAAILKSDRLSKFSESGSSDALRDALIGKFAGFQVFGSSAIPSDEAYAYVSDAFVLGVMAPANPEGATFSASAEFDGFAMRYLRDYDFTNTRDRSLVGSYVGTQTVLDPEDPTDPDSDMKLVRAVKLVLPAASI